MEIFRNCTKRRRAHPDATLLRAVMLERDGPARGNTRKLRVAEHFLAVEHDGQPIAAHRDLERVPLSDVAVGVALGGHAGADRRRHLVVGAIAVHFAGSDRPAPDVDLRLARPAKVDAGVRVRHVEADLLAVGVLLVETARQDDRHVRVDVRRGLDSPLDFQHEVAELALRVQRLVTGRFAFGVVVDHAVDDLPVTVVTGRDLPAREVLAVEEGHEPILRNGRAAARTAATGMAASFALISALV